MNTSDILSRMLSMVPQGAGMELPPKVFLDMEGEFVDFVEGKSLTIRYPNRERYSNPFGFMQGGIITAAIDNTVSPFSYVIAPPSITKEIVTKYKRPVKSTDEYIEVTATLITKTEKYLTIRGEVRNVDGKIVALGDATSVFIKNKH